MARQKRVSATEIRFSLAYPTLTRRASEAPVSKAARTIWFASSRRSAPAGGTDPEVRVRQKDDHQSDRRDTPVRNAGLGIRLRRHQSGRPSDGGHPAIATSVVIHQRQLSLVALTNTAFEGGLGAFVPAIRNLRLRAPEKISMNRTATAEELKALVAAHAAEIAALKVENEKLAQRVLHLEEQVRLERLHRYAPRSEKLKERNFNEAEQAAEGEEPG